MNYLVSLFLSAASVAHAVQLTAIEKPTGVKTRALFAHWETIYTPNLCYPDAVAYQIVSRSRSDKAENILTLAAKKASADVKKIESIKHLLTEEDVRKAVKTATDDLGVGDSELEGKLLRVFAKKDQRTVYLGYTTDGGSGDRALEGVFIGVIDNEENEVILLTYGDTFGVSGCED